MGAAVKCHAASPGFPTLVYKKRRDLLGVPDRTKPSGCRITERRKLQPARVPVERFLAFVLAGKAIADNLFLRLCCRIAIRLRHIGPGDVAQ